jgi:hypothetical protein
MTQFECRDVRLGGAECGGGARILPPARLLCNAPDLAAVARIVGIARRRPGFAPPCSAPRNVNVLMSYHVVDALLYGRAGAQVRGRRGSGLYERS